MTRNTVAGLYLSGSLFGRYWDLDTHGKYVMVILVTVMTLMMVITVMGIR